MDWEQSRWFWNKDRGEVSSVDLWVHRSRSMHPFREKTRKKNNKSWSAAKSPKRKQKKPRVSQRWSTPTPCRRSRLLEPSVAGRKEALTGIECGRPGPVEIWALLPRTTAPTTLPREATYFTTQVTSKWRGSSLTSRGANFAQTTR